MGGERSDPIRRISMEQYFWGRGPGSGRHAGRRGDFMESTRERVPPRLIWGAMTCKGYSRPLFKKWKKYTLTVSVLSVVRSRSHQPDTLLKATFGTCHILVQRRLWDLAPGLPCVLAQRRCRAKLRSFLTILLSKNIKKCKINSGSMVSL